MSSSRSLRIVFAGTPEFAAASLEALLGSQHQVIAVYTQPDRPAGRGRKLSASPVKQLALEQKIPVLQPVSLKNGIEQQKLAELRPDLIVVAAYGLILPPLVLTIPKFGCINVHASLLPRWRGAAPIQHAILAGDEETGITIMQMDAGLDTGDMLHRLSCTIGPQDTGSSLHDRLATLGAKALLETLSDLETFQTNKLPQDSKLATYAHKLEKQQALLDWTRPAIELERQVRAFNAWPVAYSHLGEQRIRIWQATAMAQKSEEAPGTIIKSDPNILRIACGEDQLNLEVIQLAGAKALPIAEVLKAKGAWFAPGNTFDSPA